MKFLQAVDKENCLKTDIRKKFGIPNYTLSTIITNWDKIVKNYETSKFELDLKHMRAAKCENLEAALPVWFRQARFQNARLQPTSDGEDRQATLLNRWDWSFLRIQVG
jgi:hypothetical protein